jgi:hypothetical protein
MKAMLLTKLKITACFAMLMLLAGVGATGLTYQATAQQPKQGAEYLAPVASRPQADDLESLRLEMEALRKELRATRERVKALEEVAGARWGKGSPQEKVDPLMKGRPQKSVDTPWQKAELPKKADMPWSKTESPKQADTAWPKGTWQRKADMAWPKGKPQSVDPVADAEAALKKLRQDPTDRQAADELERALKRLKDREKSRPLPK